MKTELIFLIAIVLFAVTQSIQSFSILLLIRVLQKLFIFPSRMRPRARFIRRLLIVNLTLFALLINCLFQIGIWAMSFVWVGEFTNYRDAFYHSAVNFATLGYGDIVMTSPWRILGALEAVSGVLMLGLSTATLSSVFRRLLAMLPKK